MQKNVTVIDSEGKAIGATYPKRAMGLVKKGRARYADGNEAVIILARPPCIETSQEDDMNNNFDLSDLMKRAETAINSTADNATEQIDRAIENLRAVVHQFEEQSKEIDTKESELETSDDEQDDVSAAESVENILVGELSSGTINEAELLARVREQVEREKLRRERELQLAQLKDDMIHRTKDLIKNTAHSVAAAAEVTKSSIDTAVSKIKSEYTSRSQLKEPVSPQPESAHQPEMTPEYILSQIEYINKNSSYLNSALSDISASEDAAAHAAANMVESREETNRRMLDLYQNMLEYVLPPKSLPANPNQMVIEQLLRMVDNDSLINDLLSSNEGYEMMDDDKVYQLIDNAVSTHMNMKRETIEKVLELL